MSYATFVPPHQRLQPITRRPIPQVPLGLHSRGGSREPNILEGLDWLKGAGQPHLLDAHHSTVLQFSSWAGLDTEKQSRKGYSFTKPV